MASCTTPNFLSDCTKSLEEPDQLLGSSGGSRLATINGIRFVGTQKSTRFGFTASVKFNQHAYSILREVQLPNIRRLTTSCKILENAANRFQHPGYFSVPILTEKQLSAEPLSLTDYATQDCGEAYRTYFVASVNTLQSAPVLAFSKKPLV